MRAVAEFALTQKLLCVTMVGKLNGKPKSFDEVLKIEGCWVLPRWKARCPTLISIQGSVVISIESGECR